MSDQFLFEDDEFNDYEFPLLGVLYSIKKDKVLILYFLNIYSMDGEIIKLATVISSDSEENADAYAASQGDIIHKVHLHSLLTYSEEEYMQRLAKQTEERIAKNE